MRLDHNRNWVHAVLFQREIFNNHSAQASHLSCNLGNHFTFLCFPLIVLPYLSSCLCPTNISKIMICDIEMGPCYDEGDI